MGQEVEGGCVGDGVQGGKGAGVWVAESLQAESVWVLCMWKFGDMYAEAALDPHDPIPDTACRVNSSGRLYS